MQDGKTTPLGLLVHQRRQALGLSIRQLAERCGTVDTTVLRIESGDIQNPRSNVVHALADALELPPADLFAVAGWLRPDELPTLRPYLRTKYRDLDDSAIADLEAYAERLRARGAGPGPRNHEDEGPADSNS